MDEAQVETSDFGSIRTDDVHDFAWFDPSPLRRSYDLRGHTLMALSRADEALGRLAGVGRMLKNPRLLMRPYAMKEALASARIEGTQAELREVLTAEARPDVRAVPEVGVVSRYLRALELGLQRVDRSKPIDIELVLEAHAALLGSIGPMPGKLRSQPVWLGSPTDRPESADFVPPVNSAMLRALDDWLEFVGNPPDLPPLIRAALIHYQFLTIHPFVDGNGRVGRLLVLLFLAAEGRLPVPLLYLSPYFENRRREYYDRLQAVRERGELEEWLQFFLTAVEVQANDGVDRAERLLDLRESYRSQLAGSRSRAAEVVELLFEYPVITTAQVREALDVSNQGALNLIRSLESRGWLVKAGNAGRGGSHLWLAIDVFETIEDASIRVATTQQ